MNKFNFARLIVILLSDLAPISARAEDSAKKNLALNRPCSVFSSYEADGWSKANLTDGKTGGLGWSSNAFLTHENHLLYPEYVIVDLGSSAKIESVVLHPRRLTARTPAKGCLSISRSRFAKRANRGERSWERRITPHRNPPSR